MTKRVREILSYYDSENAGVRANLALKVLALGGVFLGGGIAPKILPMLTNGAFVKAFLSKGRLNEILRRIEVRVALNPAAGLLGAAHCAAAML